jgi:hypothetical protein
MLHPSSFCPRQQPSDPSARSVTGLAYNHKRDRPYFGLHDIDGVEGPQHARLDDRLAIVGESEDLLP